MTDPTIAELILAQQEQTQKLIMAQQQQTQQLMKAQEEHLAKLMKRGGPGTTSGQGPETPDCSPSSTGIAASFMPFDPSSELWKDYWARFQTFAGANAISTERLPLAFLTNQSTEIYKILSTLAEQQKEKKGINQLSMTEIVNFMETQFDSKMFVVRERHKFWSEMKRKPGETVPELAARIRQDAAKCDFSAIKDPLDEAMRTRFMCSINNEAVLKSLFKLDDDKLTFQKAITAASEIEEATRVAKETVHGSEKNPVFKVHHKRTENKSTYNKCTRCGKTGHAPKECRYKDATCYSCRKKGHLAAACRSTKKQGSTTVGQIKINHVQASHPLQQRLNFGGQNHTFEVDTGSPDNFCSRSVWIKLGKEKLAIPTKQYVAATGKTIKVIGTFKTKASLTDSTTTKEVEFNVTDITLNIIGRSTIRDLNINVNKLIMEQAPQAMLNCGEHLHSVNETVNNQKLERWKLLQKCEMLCEKYTEIFQPELGCLKDFELEVKFKPNSEPKFCKPRSVPFALLNDLNIAYEAGIKKGIWERTQFNNYGTPVVPVKKNAGRSASIRVCGDYSVTINSQLETHRHPIPLPEDIMNKLGGCYYYTKIDLAEAYNQVKLGPDSKKKLALSTHQGVLLQNRLPFGITSAPGYFQEIMDQLTRDLKGVAVYLDDILISGINAEDHLQNLEALLQRCKEQGIMHLTGAPYHPATNGAAERLIQTFKQSLRKSSAPPKSALQEFLQQYRRTPLDSGLSPSELLNGRLIRTKLDALIPSPAHAAQEKQAKKATKEQQLELTGKNNIVTPVTYQYKVGAPCYALYCGPKRNNNARWVPAVITKVFGSRTMNVRVVPRGPTWRRHVDQLRPRFRSDEDLEPGDINGSSFHHDETSHEDATDENLERNSSDDGNNRMVKPPNPRLPNNSAHGPGNPRRSRRLQEKAKRGGVVGGDTHSKDYPKPKTK